MVLGVGLVLISFAAWVWTLFDIATSKPQAVRSLPKWVWLLISLVLIEVSLIAAGLWIVFGRPRAGVVSRGSGGGFSGFGGGGTSFGPTRSGSASARPTHPARGKAPIGPDDDPDFLRGLSK